MATAVPFFLSYFLAMKRTNSSKTPAPLAERIFGSQRNRTGSAASKTKARSITFSDTTTSKVESIVARYNRANPKDKVALATAKAVVRRGMGAYSSSHRPRINGRPNSRVAWGIARLNAFLRLKSRSTTANGAVSYARIKPTYNQDNDLL